MTFEVKLLITFVAIHPLVILTKFSWNPIKHVEEEANCKKKERKKERKEKKSQERNKLGDTPNLTRNCALPRARGKLGGMQKRKLRDQNKGPFGHNIINNAISCHKVI